MPNKKVAEVKHVIEKDGTGLLVVTPHPADSLAQ